MKIITYLSVLGCSINLLTNAQEIVTTSGGSMSNNAVQINWTIGEIITETISNSNNTLTSGFNQPVLEIISSIKTIHENIKLSIYPNPSKQYINIKYEGQLPINARIFSINGYVHSDLEITHPNTQFDFSGYANGIYSIIFIDKSGNINIYRIVKQ
jgi:hypothetical protein